MFGLLLVLLILTAILYFYITAERSFRFWKQHGIPYAKPSPIVGNIKDFIFGRKHLTLVFDDIYKSYCDQPFVGIFELYSPTLLIMDPALAHQIMVKDFSHFQDRMKNFSNDDLDPFSSHLVNLTGVKWKATRSKLMPAFSSGKLKQMFPLIEDCVHELDRYIAYEIAKSDQLEISEIMAKYTTDVIGRVTLGVDCRSLSDPNADFRRIGRKIFKFSYRLFLRIIVRLIFPKLITFVRIRVMPPEVENFFYKVLQENIELRNSYANGKGKRKTDFLQLMLDIQDREKETKVSEEETFTDELLVANMFVFFSGGFETSATTMSLCIYELALNQEVQNKLRDEIKSVLSDQSKKLFSYETINNLKYLDLVLNGKNLKILGIDMKEVANSIYSNLVFLETLRKYPPIPFHTRTCTQTYLIPGTDVTLKPGTRVTIPIYSIQRDPRYFPQPEKFNPDRFIDMDKNMTTYSPFGDGPRICIGLKLAKTQIKCCMVSLLLKYSFVPTDQTNIPIEIKARSLFLRPTNGIILKVNKFQDQISA